MRMGVNLTRSADIPLVRRLHERGHIDYCEVLVDNFWTWSPQDLSHALPSIPIGLHIMQSSFIDGEIPRLAQITDKIKKFSDQLNPLYVSDHAARFFESGRPLLVLQELDYLKHAEVILNRIHLYVRQLGDKNFFLENFPSMFAIGRCQPHFFKVIQYECGVSPLFDISNAVLSRKNGIVDECQWLALTNQTTHFHLGGFSQSPDNSALFIDTHDAEIDGQSLAFIKKILNSRRDHEDCTLTIERDNQISLPNFVQDISRVKAALNEC